MQKQLALVEEFHRKFGVAVASRPSLISPVRATNRHELMASEVEEYLAGVENRDLENVAKELADILYTVYGTILEHGLQEKMEAVFSAVHRSNLSKSYAEFKMVKGDDYVEPTIGELLRD